MCIPYSIHLLGGYNLYLFFLFHKVQPVNYRSALFGQQSALKCMNLIASRQGIHYTVHCAIPISPAVFCPLIHIFMPPTGPCGHPMWQPRLLDSSNQQRHIISTSEYNLILNKFLLPHLLFYNILLLKSQRELNIFAFYQHRGTPGCLIHSFCPGIWLFPMLIL